MLVGPYEESQQWVDDIASHCGADSIVLAKQRFGDHEVSIDANGLPTPAGHTPVLVDDMVSTARTMLASARLLLEHGCPAPICVAVHTLFAEAAYSDLQAVAADIFTSDTVAHHPTAFPWQSAWQPAAAAGATRPRRSIMSKLKAQETISLAEQLDAEEAHIHAAVGSADTPMTPLAQREARDEADLADEEITQRQDDAMLDHYRMQLADIAAARARMQHGQYGTCIDCQQPIPFSRLQAYPTAKRCTACQRRMSNFMRDSWRIPGTEGN
ncbi:TraR/DksA C4-type zinc finger protein [Cupriavidus sp. P-10]|uniref:TraR/DksA C4-type zinc finger protein n=1 Tax=Cupriavidus sp. P-10 TaxID=2027911 RepID=UPI0011C1B0DE|nr:TraR/DksA C4-type zinc finger protein [Cupriavidus sp. P-10]